MRKIYRMFIESVMRYGIKCYVGDLLCLNEETFTVDSVSIKKAKYSLTIRDNDGVETTLNGLYLDYIKCIKKSIVPAHVLGLKKLLNENLELYDETNDELFYVMFDEIAVYRGGIVKCKREDKELNQRLMGLLLKQL